MNEREKQVERNVAQLLAGGEAEPWRLDYLMARNRDGGFLAKVTAGGERWYSGVGDSPAAALKACFVKELEHGKVG